MYQCGSQVEKTGAGWEDSQISGIGREDPVLCCRDMADHIRFDIGRDIDDRLAIDGDAMSEGKYQTLFDMATDSLVITDLNGVIEDVNRAGYERLGYTKEEMVGRNVAELHAPEFRPLVAVRIAELKEKGGVIFETAHVRKDGSILPVEINTRLVMFDGEPKLFGIARDISERWQMGRALSEAQALYYGAIEASVDGFWVVDMQGRFLEVNEAYVRRSGYSREELLGMCIEDVEARETPEETAGHIRQISQDGYALFETLHRAKDGSAWPVEVACSFWPMNGGRLFVHLTDISGRKRIEETVRLSKQSYRSLYDNMMDGYAHCRLLFEDGAPKDFLFLEINPAFEEMTGLRGLEGKKINRGIWEQSPELFDIFCRVSLGGRSERFETYISELNKWFMLSVYSPEPEHFIAIFDDITGRKREEQVLHKHLDYLSAHANDIILLSDATGRIVDVNLRAIESYGYTREEFSSMYVSDLRAPDSVASFEEIQERILKKGAMRFESEHVRKDGSRFAVESSVRVIDIDGEKYFQNIARDISRRKLAEEMLRDRERKLAEAQRLAKLGSWTWNVATGSVQWSDEMFRMLGYQPKGSAPAYEEYLSSYMPGSRVLFEVAVEQARFEGKASQYDLELAEKEGRPKWVTARFEPVRDMDGGITGIRGTIQDISERKQQEALVRAASKEVADLYNNAPCGYHSLDKDGFIVAINYTELTWLGYRREEVVGKMRFPSLLSAKSKEMFYDTFPRLKKQGWIRDVELELVRRDGSTLPVLISATVVKDEYGNFMMTRSTVYDMTEHKILERERMEHARRLQELAHSMVDMQEKERRWLSSELHDRSSANLAAIGMNFRNLVGALPEQALSSVNDLLADTQALLEDSTSSIREICANLRPALLDYAGLWPALEGYAQQYSRRTGIEVRLRNDDGVGRFTSSTESKLFRIVQEALMNSAKHASASAVDVCLGRENGDTVLSISDDGRGFDPGGLGRNGSRPGMGLIMMRERTEFFGGKFSYETAPGKGMRIRIVIPPEGRNLAGSYTSESIL